jgi:NAD(P)-dependent dehydrogenase (short-subunit alcohol dehydrogenase family)
VNAAFAKVIGDFGGSIDILVSNAAMNESMEPVGTADSDSFLNAIHKNLNGSMFVAQAFLRHAAPDAVVIDVNSSAAHMNFQPRFASYSIAKFAVFRLWDSVGFENPGLSVFHLQPGVVDTDMNKVVGGVAAIGFEDHGRSSQFNW